MRQRKFSHRPRSEQNAVAFATAEEAWFWGMQCFAARAEGARYRAGLAALARPCDPDDLLVSVESLVRMGRLRAAHIRTLFSYGRKLAAPDARRGDETEAARLWDEALDRLTTPLRQKGIVA